MLTNLFWLQVFSVCNGKLIAMINELYRLRAKERYKTAFLYCFIHSLIQSQEICPYSILNKYTKKDFYYGLKGDISKK